MENGDHGSGDDTNQCHTGGTIGISDIRTLKTYLPDDYIIYCEPEIRNNRPDFVIIGQIWDRRFGNQRLYPKYIDHGPMMNGIFSPLAENRSLSLTR